MVIRALAVVAVLAAALAGAALSRALDSEPPAPSAGIDASPAPGSGRVDATAMHPRREVPLGVLVYKNAEGRKCFASGDVRGDEVGRIHADGSFERLPLGEGGNCGATPDPIAVQLERVRDVPATPENEAETRVWGIAREGVVEVTVDAGGESRSSRVGRDGGFILTFGHTALGTVAIDSLQADGSVERVSLPPGPDLDALSEAARAGAPARR